MHLTLFDNLTQVFQVAFIFALGTGFGQIIRDLIATVAELGMRSIVYNRAMKQLKKQQTSEGN